MYPWKPGDPRTPAAPWQREQINNWKKNVIRIFRLFKTKPNSIPRTRTQNQLNYPFNLTVERSTLDLPLHKRHQTNKPLKIEDEKKETQQLFKLPEVVVSIWRVLMAEEIRWRTVNILGVLKAGDFLNWDIPYIEPPKHLPLYLFIYLFTYNSHFFRKSPRDHVRPDVLRFPRCEESKRICYMFIHCSLNEIQVTVWEQISNRKIHLPVFLCRLRTQFVLGHPLIPIWTKKNNDTSGKIRKMSSAAIEESNQ